MTGFELLQIVKALRPDLSVFMIPAYGDPATVASALERGANIFRTEPVDFPHSKQDITAPVARAVDFR